MGSPQSTPKANSLATPYLRPSPGPVEEDRIEPLSLDAILGSGETLQEVAVEYNQESGHSARSPT